MMTLARAYVLRDAKLSLQSHQQQHYNSTGHTTTTLCFLLHPPGSPLFMLRGDLLALVFHDEDVHHVHEVSEGKEDEGEGI